MTVLTAVQNACKKPSLGLFPTPTALFSSTEQNELELCSLANEAAQMIAKAHDWQLLTTLKTQAGDGSDTTFDLPTDYDRMPVKASVYLTSTKTQLSPVTDLDRWQEIQLLGLSGVVGWWIIIGGQMNVYPAIASTDSAKYYYQSNLIVTPNSGSNKATFTLDTDTFRLPERLLTLAIIWMWRAEKGLDYQQELSDFNMAFGQETGRDRGSHIIRLGRARIPDGVSTAFPASISV